MSTKNRLLGYLKESKGVWVSGESLSHRIGITRSAIWKNIGKLREEGYIIESSPNKGYSLSKISEMLLPNEIREGLDTEVWQGGNHSFQRNRLHQREGKGISNSRRAGRDTDCI